MLVFYIIQFMGNVLTNKQAFDQQTGYKRDQQENFAYPHAIKNGRIAAIWEQARIRVEQDRHYSRDCFLIRVIKS